MSMPIRPKFLFLTVPEMMPALDALHDDEMIVEDLMDPDAASAEPRVYTPQHAGLCAASQEGCATQHEKASATVGARKSRGAAFA